MTVKKFLSVAKMAPTVYETETCGGYIYLFPVLIGSLDCLVI